MLFRSGNFMAFDLDDDELKATKIMNGTLKDEEEKDEEEKDIKFIRKYMQDYFFEDIAIKDDFEFEKAIENLLTKYKNLKEIEESHRKENGELRERVKELEEKNRIFALEGSKVRLQIHIENNYIPKLKLKEFFSSRLEKYQEADDGRYEQEYLTRGELELVDRYKECKEIAEIILKQEVKNEVPQDCIPKSVIKEKIDKKQKQLELLKKELQGRQTNFVNKNIITGQIQVLQELLEKRK